MTNIRQLVAMTIPNQSMRCIRVSPKNSLFDCRDSRLDCTLEEKEDSSDSCCSRELKEAKDSRKEASAIKNSNAFFDMTLYSAFDLDKTCTVEQITKAYRKLALQLHPDRGGSKEEFQKISEYYNILSDPHKRKLYDQTGEINPTLSDEYASWEEYFALLYKRVTTNDILKFSKEYKCIFILPRF